MKRIWQLKRNILLRDGHFILLANMIDRIVNFVLMIIAARYMTLSMYGNFSYVKSMVAALTPFAGLGGNHALLRFGMDQDALKEKYRMLVSALFFGTGLTLLMLLGIKLFVTGYDLLDSEALQQIFNLYLFYILTYYIYDVVRNFYRIQYDNRTYATNTIKYSLSTLIVGALTLVFFDPMVFIVVLVFLPLLVTVVDNRKLLFQKIPSLQFEWKFWKYGTLIGAGAFLNQFFMQSDILILGYLHSEAAQIAQYKVATLLVYTFIFIPNAFLVRDFALLSAHAKDRVFLVKYIVAYLKHASIILLFIVPAFYLLSHPVLIALFGDKFQNDLNIQNILIMGLVFIVLLRMPFANLLNAVGKANLNVINAILTLLVAIPALLFLTKTYGIIGTAYAMAGLFLFSGVVALGMFLYYVKTIKG